MKTYIVTDTENGHTQLEASSKEEAQEIYIDLCEASGIMFGELRIVRMR